MSLTALDNLARIGQLKIEPRNDAEISRMLAMARTRLADADLASLSLEGRFTSAYNAAHAAALAALRWRPSLLDRQVSDNRPPLRFNLPQP
ncbi:MAG: hypothetical protein Q8O79_04910 [Pseudomonadota bacterium]|nr:hypothetical protein [Pseudomonadota bacterium]